MALVAMSRDDPYRGVDDATTARAVGMSEYQFTTLTLTALSPTALTPNPLSRRAGRGGFLLGLAFSLLPASRGEGWGMRGSRGENGWDQERSACACGRRYSVATPRLQATGDELDAGIDRDVAAFAIRPDRDHCVGD